VPEVPQSAGYKYLTDIGAEGGEREERKITSTTQSIK
jgi:hypothetical protein